jgi:catechol 2,3-dioxygenase-like lactoylglutathione lyase family enzyme
MIAEVRNGIESIDHVAIPVRDLTLNQDFYVDVLGLKLKTVRHNLDGSPRQSYLLAGDNIIGLHLPGIIAGASASSGPRIGISVSEERFKDIQQNLTATNHRFTVPVRHSAQAPTLYSLLLDDPDGNHLELCVRRQEPVREGISHVVFETRDANRSMTFYTEALGTGVPTGYGNEIMIPVQSGQMIGLVTVDRLSERSAKHGRGCHMAMNVCHEDFDAMVALVERYGGRTQGDRRADDGLRPEGERSLYLFDPDNNRLQITAHSATQGELLADDEKWRRITSNRKQQGRGLSRWESGGKKVPQ